MPECAHLDSVQLLDLPVETIGSRFGEIQVGFPRLTLPSTSLAEIRELVGPAMAIALLTTLYGAVTAFLLCNPIAAKLERRSSEESASMSVIIEGVDSIVKGHNAAIIKDKLQARLAPKDRPTEQEAA